MNTEDIKGRANHLSDTVTFAARSAATDISKLVDDSIIAARDSYTQAQDATESYVRTNPWKAVGFALLGGYILAKLCSSSR